MKINRLKKNGKKSLQMLMLEQADKSKKKKIKRQFKKEK